MERTRWIQLIKSVRQEHDVGIFEAERIALADPQRRRWVERQINGDTQCRKMARFQMRLQLHFHPPRFVAIIVTVLASQADARLACCPWWQDRSLLC